jgi:hypothetical protein
MSDVDTDVSESEGGGGTGPTPGGKQARRRIVLAVGAVVLVAGAGGAFFATRPGPAKDHRLTGTLVLSNNEVPDPCNPSDTYSDVSDGAPITVQDDNDKILARGSLDKGILGEVPFDPTAGFSRTTELHKVCRHSFAVVVPETGFYRFTIGKRNIAYTKKDLVARNWAIILNLSAPPTPAG